jgi:hypothetical protein
MKKFFLMSAAALLALGLSQQQASAWANFKFGIGLNICYTSGNNCLLWGLVRNGQVPPFPTDYGPSCLNPGGFPAYAGAYYGGEFSGYDYGHASTTPQTPKTATPSSGGSQAVQYQGWNANAGYQPVGYSYQPNPYGYYQGGYYGYGW